MGIVPTTILFAGLWEKSEIVQPVNIHLKSTRINDSKYELKVTMFSFLFAILNVVLDICLMNDWILSRLIKGVAAVCYQRIHKLSTYVRVVPPNFRYLFFSSSIILRFQLVTNRLDLRLSQETFVSFRAPCSSITLAIIVPVTCKIFSSVCLFTTRLSPNSAIDSNKLLRQVTRWFSLAFSLYCEC